MRACFLASAALLLAPTSTPVQAVPVSGATFMFESGTSLLAKCHNKTPEYRLACTAYIVGVVDGIRKDLFIGRGRQLCWPERMSADEARNIVVAYLEKWPDQQPTPASVLVSVALNDHYPCQK